MTDEEISLLWEKAASSAVPPQTTVNWFAKMVAQQAIAEALVSVSHAVAEEREACAKICDETWVEPGDMQVESCHDAAKKIRERSNK